MVVNVRQDPERASLWDDASVGDMVRVYSTSRIFEGELTKGRLEDEGIPVLLKGEGEGPYRTGPVYVLVPVEFEARAREVLAAIDRGDYAVDAADTVESEVEPER